ncbi:MAG: flagellar protein FlaG [Alphaproteobacteria bacterium]|nr:flagellar protein FlaG [Alphaproteobacteria bacterium]
MIEAVNSAIANTSLVRGGAEQAAVARPSSARTNEVQSSEGAAPVLAPYISPFVYVDAQFNKAVLQIRDSDTGEVQRQFPSEQTLQARAAAQDVIEDRQLLDQELSRPSSSPSSQGTLQSATLFAASEIGSSSSAQIRVPEASSTSAPSSGVNVAQAQIASAALSASSAPPSGSTVNTSA